MYNHEHSIHHTLRHLLDMHAQREEELLSSWWEEYAECSEGPRERSGSTSKSDPQAKVSSLERARSAHYLHAIEEERVGVPVKGGLYEVSFLSIFFFC